MSCAHQGMFDSSNYVFYLLIFAPLLWARKHACLEVQCPGEFILEAFFRLLLYAR
jgi:hypothetical protein